MPLGIGYSQSRSRFGGPRQSTTGTQTNARFGQPSGGPQGVDAAVLNRPMLPPHLGGTQISPRHAQSLFRSGVLRPDGSLSQPVGELIPSASSRGPAQQPTSPVQFGAPVPLASAPAPPSPPAGVPQFMQPDMTPAAAAIRQTRMNPAEGSGGMPPGDLPPNEVNPGALPRVDQLEAMDLPFRQVPGTPFGLRNPVARALAVNNIRRMNAHPDLNLTREGTALNPALQADVQADMAQRRSSQPLGMAGFMPERTATGQPIATDQQPFGQPRAPLTVEDVTNSESGLFAPTGLSTSTTSPPRTSSRTRVEEGIFGGARLIGPQHGMDPAMRARHREESLADQQARMQPYINRRRGLTMTGEEVPPGPEAARQARIQRNISQLAPSVLEARQQRTGRTFGMPRVGVDEDATARPFGQPAPLPLADRVTRAAEQGAPPVQAVEDAVSAGELDEQQIRSEVERLAELPVTSLDEEQRAQLKLYRQYLNKIDGAARARKKAEELGPNPVNPFLFRQ